MIIARRRLPFALIALGACSTLAGVYLLLGLAVTLVIAGIALVAVGFLVDV